MNNFNNSNINPTIKTMIFCIVTISAVCAVLWNKMIFIAPLILLSLFVGIWKKYFSIVFSAILIFCFILTSFYTQIRKPAPDILYFYDQQNIILEGTISSLPDKSIYGKTKFKFDTKKLIDKNGNEKIIKGKTQVYLGYDIQEKVSRGDNLRLYSFVTVPKNFSNPGEFDYGKYLSNYNIFTLSFVNKMEKLETQSKFIPQILKYIDKIREKIITEHEKYLTQAQTEILGGIVFGSEAIKPSPELKATFINSGLYHLLAASGMNVAFIFGIWFFLLIRFKLPYRFCIISGGVIVIFYALMTGLPPSVTRATWMLELGLLGKLLDRNSDNNVILLLVCTILLIYNPLMLNDIGFLLSFMVTFGLINCAAPIINAIKFIPAKISGWIVIPFIAQIFAAPIQMYYFQTLSLYSIIANMLVVPFMALISFCGFISSILALIPKIGTYICMFLDKINQPFLTFMLLVAEKISALPNNTIQVGKLHFIEIILYYLLIFIFIYMAKCNFKNIRTNIFAILLSIALIFSSIYKSSAGDLSFTFLNVGEADSIFIQTPNNKKILVDTGKNYGKTKNSGNSIIIPFLRTKGINCIDLLILTHPDSDHIGGTIDILENIDVKKLVTNGEKAQNQTFLKLKEYINSTGRKEYTISKPIEISPDKNLSIIAIKPPDTDAKSQNDTSIILIFKYKNFDAILMGDNEITSYETLKTNLNPTGAIELFKIGHHGSYNSVDEKMVKLISPDISVISVGENSYGHPHPKTLYALRNSKIYRTDMDNTIKIKTNGKTFDVYTYNPEKSIWRKNNRQTK